MSNAMQFKARIKNLALKHNIPAQAVLQNFMLERLLERISLSRYKSKIILKGGLLVASLVGIQSRTTMDMDTTLQDFPLKEEAIQIVFQEICAIPVDDGVNLVVDHIAPIRADDEYGGFRVAVIASYGAIYTPLKIDITTGDCITPEAVWYSFPSGFENKAIDILAYNLETILAEKVETILHRSVLNTRIRDFYDVYVLMKTHRQSIDKVQLRVALQNTSQARGSLSILAEYENILRIIQADEVMNQRWVQYAKAYTYANGLAFTEVIDPLLEILRS